MRKSRITRVSLFCLKNLSVSDAPSPLCSHCPSPLSLSLLPAVPLPLPPHSPLPTPHSPLPTPHSPLPTPHTPLPTPRSPLPTPHCPLLTPHSPLPVPLPTVIPSVVEGRTTITLYHCRSRAKPSRVASDRASWRNCLGGIMVGVPRQALNFVRAARNDR